MSENYSLQDKVVNLLMKEFDNPYCLDCRHNAEGEVHRAMCENCFRKSIGWQVSEQKATKVFLKLIEIINDHIAKEQKQ